MDFSSHYKIQLNPVGLTSAAATTYKSKVTEHLTWIYRTKVGKILLDCIRFHGLPVEIRPYAWTDCNSKGGWRVAEGNVRGYVEYSPDTFSLHGACPVNRTAPNRGLLWDEVLFHELVHAFRGVSKKWNQVTLGAGLIRYDDTEEFLAVLITNIYISDRSNKIKTGLRADHKTLNPMQADLAAPFGFFASSSQVLTLVRKFVADNHGLAIMLANADAPFNPIADYVASPDKAEQVSRTALPRDLAGLTIQIAQWAAQVFH